MDTPVFYSLITLAFAFTLEFLIGEPKNFHPLVGLGNIINKVESIFNVGTPKEKRIKGALSAIVITATPATIVHMCYINLSPILGAIFAGAVLWSAIGLKSLIQHCNNIYQPLLKGNISEARKKLSRIVSRDTNHLNESDIVKATCESTLENECDAVIAPLFWGVLFGPIAIVMHRCVNTLDAMWGYKSPRYIDFGKFAAKMDDIANYVPARLTALSYLVVAKSRSNVITSWQTQAKKWDSPNAGLVMATGAASIGIKLGGSARYNGSEKIRAVIGFGALPTTNNLANCVRLIVKATIVSTSILIAIKLFLSL